MKVRGTNVNVRVVDDYGQLSKEAARIVADRLRAAPASVLGLATGGTPVGMYEELVRMHRDEGLDFSRATTFNLDEYYPIEPSDPNSYYAYMREHLFANVNLNAEKTHLPSGEAADAPAECERYERLIREAGGIDLQVLGIGKNAHIGFNEPGTDFGTETHLTDLSEETRRANARFFPSEEEVPTRAISMGIASILRARAILLLASGPDKAEAIGAALTGDVSPGVPASALQRHSDVLVLADRAAARQLETTS